MLLSDPVSCFVLIWAAHEKGRVTGLVTHQTPSTKLGDVCFVSISVEKSIVISGTEIEGGGPVIVSF